MKSVGMGTKPPKDDKGAAALKKEYDALVKSHTELMAAYEKLSLVKSKQDAEIQELTAELAALETPK